MNAIKDTFFRRLLRYFLAGVFAILPLVITVAVAVWVAGFVSNLIGPETFLGGKLQALGLQYVSNPSVAYAFGWIVVLGAVFLLGVLVEFGAKRLFQQIVDLLLDRIPLISGVYDTSKRLVGMMDNKGGTDMAGMSVVFCLFGKEHGMGLLALLVSPDRFRINGRDYQVVIVPTAPVPVGGGLLFVPVESVIPADMSADGLMSIYVSMGVTAREFLPPRDAAGEASGK